LRSAFTLEIGLPRWHAPPPAATTWPSSSPTVHRFCATRTS